MPRTIDRRVQRARTFRQNPTDAERKLWQLLRKLPHPSAHFHRQPTIGPYFADFACHTTRLMIEIGGGQHADSAPDEVRTAYLNANGYCVLRFWNNDVLTNLEGVFQIISAAIGSPPTPDLSPLQERVEGGKALEGGASPPPMRVSRGGQGSGVGSSCFNDQNKSDLPGGSA